jgi:pimeloyl-ACP methyl ester carboxylesterase
MTTLQRARSQRLSATAADLPTAVAAALAAPPAGSPGWVDVEGTRWSTLAWGRPEDPPVLLIHGVTSNAGIWWRVGPALAAAGHQVIALDMPGHGRTKTWSGRHRFVETAEEVAGFIDAAGLDRPDLAVIGHSWGAMITAHLPLAGVRPRLLILLDPPSLTVAQFKVYVQDPTERPYSTVAEAAEVMRTANPTWSEGDIAAKAEALTQFDPEAVLAVLLRNGDWDSGMAALRDPRAAGVSAWLIRGEWDTGCLIPDLALPGIVAQLGGNHVITIEGAPHSPQRTHPEATVVALLRALDRSSSLGNPPAS